MNIENHYLNRSKHGIYIAGCVVVDNCEHNGMHKCNNVLGTGGGDSQQHVGAKNVKQENQINEAGKVKHLMCLGL